MKKILRDKVADAIGQCKAFSDQALANAALQAVADHIGVTVEMLETGRGTLTIFSNDKHAIKVLADIAERISHDQ